MVHAVNQPQPLPIGLWALPLALGLAACGGEVRQPGATADSGISQDAGAGDDASARNDASDGDAGNTTDSGVQMDGGTATDGGALDAGSPDSGTVPTGPITAPDETWTWVDFPEAKCINGSPTGIGVNIKPGSTKLMIFLMGGNACFNQASCFVTANLNGYGEAEFNQELSMVQGTFILDRSQAANIFNDYSFVYVPYCTGDVHAGSQPNGSVAGSSYSFTGYDNITAYLDRLVPTFPNVTEVVLSGVSAGGFGAMLNFQHVQSAFGDDVRVTLVDDSGPPMGGAYIAPCLQAHFRDTWGYDTGLLADCAECLATPDRSFIEPFFDQLMTLYADRNFAVISSDGDEVIRGFWGFGQNSCRNINDIFPPAYPPATYRAGLEDFRDNIAMGLPNVGLYMKTGSTRHVWLNSDPRTIDQDGVTLSDWLSQAISDDPAWGHVPSGN